MTTNATRQPVQNAVPASSWLRNNAGLLVLLLLTFFIYFPSLSGDFVVDDVPMIRDNPHIRNFSDISGYFTKGLWENSALGISNDPRYLPMVLVPMLLNHQLWGGNPFGYHLYALLAHLIATCLVYILVRRLSAGSAWAATFGAAFFALHPTRVESVAWIVGSVEPLVVIFLLGALLAHQSFVDRPDNKRGWGYLALALICLQLALWSKEVALTFPFIVIAHDLIYRKKVNWLAVSLYGAVATGYLGLRSLVLGTSATSSHLDLSQFSRALDFASGYSELLIFPWQIPFYLKSPEHAVSSVLGIIGALVIVAAIAYCWRTFDSGRRKSLVFALIWIIGFIWPAAAMAFYDKGFYFARWLYIPAIGGAILVSAFYDHVSETSPRMKTPLVALCGLILGLYGFVTWKEIPAWRNDETFYGKVVQFEPEGAAGYCGLGQYHFMKDDYVSAEKQFQLCLQKAKTPDVKVDALVKLGTIHGMANDLAASENYLRQVLRIDAKNPEALSGLGNLALMRGLNHEAISLYEQALSARPGNYETAMNLAMAYEKTGQYERAERIKRSLQ